MKQTELKDFGNAKLYVWSEQSLDHLSLGDSFFQ